VQHEDEVHRLAIDAVEINRCGETREEAVDAVDVGETAVRNGNALAETGRAQLLAAVQRFEDNTLVGSNKSGNRLGEFLQHLLLVLGLHRGKHGAGVDDVCKSHSISNSGSYKSA